MRNKTEVALRKTKGNPYIERYKIIYNVQIFATHIPLPYFVNSFVRLFVSKEREAFEWYSGQSKLFGQVVRAMLNTSFSVLTSRSVYLKCSSVDRVSALSLLVVTIRDLNNNERLCQNSVFLSTCQITKCFIGSRK